MTQEEITLAVQAEKIRQLVQTISEMESRFNTRLSAAERKIWGAVLGVLGITVTIASEIVKAGIQ